MSASESEQGLFGEFRAVQVETLAAASEPCHLASESHSNKSRKDKLKRDVSDLQVQVWNSWQRPGDPKAVSNKFCGNSGHFTHYGFLMLIITALSKIEAQVYYVTLLSNIFT